MRLLRFEQAIVRWKRQRSAYRAPRAEREVACALSSAGSMSSAMWMPSIWMTSRSRWSSRVSIHSFMRAIPSCAPPTARRSDRGKARSAGAWRASFSKEFQVFQSFLQTFPSFFQAFCKDFQAFSLEVLKEIKDLPSKEPEFAFFSPCRPCRRKFPARPRERTCRLPGR